ncbi:IS30 family transposase [Gemmatimonas sp.]|uniref:IS30 family transposase n=1 Tax=Gemmatimonas sp. TaxID=1962908 RepID=UPI00286DDC1C|nr:IS30 family transposase [Gemmatimonas sp.]
MGNRKGRGHLSPSERAEVWRRWRTGERLAEIAVALQVSEIGVYQHIRKAVGIAELPRLRAAFALMAAEREVISRGLVEALSFRAIAQQIGRPTSTVSREVGRTGGRGTFRAVRAEAAAWERASRPKRCKLATRVRLRRLVAAKLEAKWSPEQIAGWLKRQFPSQPELHVSHETIYRTLYLQARGALKRELTAHLRTQRTERGRRTKPTDRRGRIRDAVSIRERPAEVEDRAVQGHWEGDLLTGRGSSYIATLAERRTRYVVLVNFASKAAPHVAQRLQRQLQHLPEHLIKTLTWDRGHETAEHRAFAVATDMQVYFCDPHSPWQRGTNKNTNGLLHQYFPRSLDLSRLTQRELNAVAQALNNRPRATLDFKSPAEMFNELLR